MDPFFYLVILAGAIAGASCGLLGVYLVALRLPFIGVFISHTAMAGTVYAYLLGFNPTAGPIRKPCSRWNCVSHLARSVKIRGAAGRKFSMNSSQVGSTRSR